MSMYVTQFQSEATEGVMIAIMNLLTFYSTTSIAGA